MQLKNLSIQEWNQFAGVNVDGFSTQKARLHFSQIYQTAVQAQTDDICCICWDAWMLSHLVYQPFVHYSGGSYVFGPSLASLPDLFIALRFLYHSNFDENF